MRLEERCERPFAALSIVHRGLQEIPRYGPLWFGLFRVAEQVSWWW
jgi:la-related protein 1